MSKVSFTRASRSGGMPGKVACQYVDHASASGELARLTGGFVPKHSGNYSPSL